MDLQFAIQQIVGVTIIYSAAAVAVGCFGGAPPLPGTWSGRLRQWPFCCSRSLRC